MTASRTIRIFLVTLFVLSFLFLTETLFASLLGSGLPLPLWYSLSGLMVIAVVSGLTACLGELVQTYFGNWSRTLRSVCFYLSLSVVFGKIYRVGSLTHWFPYVLASVGVLVCFSVSSYVSKFGGVFAPLLITVVLATTSTYFFRQIWLYLNHLNAFGSSLLALCFLVLIGALVLGYASSRLDDRFLTKNGNALYFLPLTIVLWITTAGILGLTSEPPQWSFTAPYTGQTPTVVKESHVTDLPNVIVISLDTMRLDEFWSKKHGNRFGQLRSDGISLTELVSTSSWTLPANASLLTGKLPHRAGAVRTNTQLYETVPSFVQFLRQAGYTTGAFTDGGYIHKNFGFGRGFETYWHQTPKIYGEYVPGPVEFLAPIFGFPGDDFNHSPVLESLRPPSRNYTRRSVEKAEQWIRRKRPNPEPFFLFLHTYQAHDYWMRFPETLNWLRDKHPELADVLEARETRSIIRFDGVSKPLIKAYQKLYEREMKRTVTQLEQFLDDLRNQGLYRKSLILFMTDHGEAFSHDPLVVGHNKGQLHEILLRVPAVLKLPDNRFGGRKLNNHLSIRDLFPILLNELNLTLHNGTETRSLHQLRTLLENPDVERTLTQGSVLHRYVRGRYHPKLFVRSEKYLMTKTLAGGKQRFYKLINGDPFQNPIGPEAIPAGARTKLEREMKHYLKDVRRAPDPYNSSKSVSDGRKRMLDGLGYF